MATRTPYYADPLFAQKMQTMGQPVGRYGSPFAATQNAVAANLEARRNAALGNTFGMAQAQAQQRQSLFNNNLAWQGYQQKMGRVGRQASFDQTMDYQRRMEEAARKAKKKAGIGAMVGAGLGAIGGAAGTIFGGPVGGAVGSQLGSQIGGSIYG